MAHLIQKWGLIAASIVLIAVSGSNIVRADSVSYTQWAPTKGNVKAYNNTTFPGKRSVDSWIRWETTSTCNTSSALCTFCSNQHRVYEHNIEMSNYGSVYPQEYRWGKYPEAWNGNFPGTAYLDTQASDDPNIESWTVGTLDAPQFSAYTTYYANVLGSPDYPGPNWWQLRHEYGNIDQAGCGIWVSPWWCMLYPHGGRTRIPMSWHYTFPGEWSWNGQ